MPWTGLWGLLLGEGFDIPPFFPQMLRALKATLLPELKASRWDRRGDEACLTLKQIRAARFSGANLTISVLPPPRGARRARVYTVGGRKTQRVG